MRSRSFYLLCCALVSVLDFVVLLHPVTAEEIAVVDQPETIEVPDVVVSATKTEIPVKRVTSAVEVITEEDLKRRQIKTVVDALRLSQGLSVFSNGGPGSSATVRIRGSNPDQVLVLIDGAIMNSATLGSFNFANLTTDNIERIEILRGAQSMLWGADAMGGVINITTKKGTGPPSVGAFVEYGSFQSIREGAQVSGRKGPVDISAAISRWDFTGFSAVNFRRGAAERDGFHNWQGSTRMGVSLPLNGRLDLNFRLMRGRTDFDNGFPPGFDVLGAVTTSQQFVYGLSYNQPITPWWNQVLSLTRQTETLETSPGTIQRNILTGALSTPFGSRSEINTSANRVEWQHNLQIAEPLLLTAGYQFREQRGENLNLDTGIPDITSQGVSSHAGFGQVQLNLWDRFFATGGGRVDRFNVFGTAKTYRVTGGYLHSETGTKVRASYATGFRAPTLNQLFFPGFGNTNLQPERSLSLDVGIDQYLFNNRVTVSFSYFWNQFRDLIVAQQSATLCGVGPFGPNFCAQNIGVVQTKGWEVSVKAIVLKDLPGIRSLEVQAQYTHTLSRNAQTGNRAPRIPVDQGSLILSYQPIEPIRVTLEGRFVGARFEDVNNTQPLSAFKVWNVTANYEVIKGVQAYVRADNLFDEEYEEVLNLGTPVRSVFGGVRVTYN